MSKHNPEPPIEAEEEIEKAGDLKADEAKETPPGPENKPVDWEQKSAELEGKLADLNDQYLRKAADFENYRKRMNREKQEVVDFANQSLLMDLLPVIDDFERAIKSAETSRDFNSLYEGVSMIARRLASEMENKWGLKSFDSEGEPFDPNRHEALQTEKAAGISEAVVKEDYVKGYFLKNRVIRFAKVKVLMPEETVTPQGGETGNEDQGP
jgi:molecular chaperone GrpE